MNEERIFIGRKKELNDFDKFIAGEKSGEDGKNKPVLLVVADPGMGKTALLQAMAHRAANQNHYVSVGEVDKSKTEFAEQIYPLIAILRKKRRLQLGKGRNWLKLGLIGIGIAGGLYGVAAGLGALLTDIRKEHKTSGSSPISLAELFHAALSKVSKKLSNDQKLIIFLDPEKESPPGLIPLLRNIGNLGIPSKVRIVIAQRPEDIVINAIKEEKIRYLFANPLQLSYMSEKEDLEFITIYSINQKLKSSLKSVFLERYGGWPLLMKLALEEVSNLDGEITKDTINNMPLDIREFWRDRYKKIFRKESRTFVQTVCLLAHPYPKEMVARFAGLKPPEMEATWNDERVWKLLAKGEYQETFSNEIWKESPMPQHATLREYVLAELTDYRELLQERLNCIASHYKKLIGDDYEGAKVSKDALVHLPQLLFEHKDWGNFIKQINRLTRIKYRYGLLDSLEADSIAAMKVSETFDNMELIALYSGNLGIVYRTRGDLDQAEAMYKKSLKINKALGRKEGMAKQFANIGNVYRTQGDLEVAEAMYKKSLELFKSIGAKSKAEKIEKLMIELK